MEHIAISCINCEKKTGLLNKITNTNCQDIITSFVLNIVLRHVGMSWIIETNKHLEYNMEKKDSDWIIGGPSYNTFICKNLYRKVFEEFIMNAITDRYNIMCFIDAHEKIIHQNMMTVAAVVFVQYH